MSQLGDVNKDIREWDISEVDVAIVGEMGKAIAEFLNKLETIVAREWPEKPSYGGKMLYIALCMTKEIFERGAAIKGIQLPKKKEQQ